MKYSFSGIAILFILTLFPFSGNLLFARSAGPYTDSDSGKCPEAVTADYYQAAYKLSGPALLSALHNIIKGHNSVSYASLWTHYQTTDKKSNGKVWDMYSDVPNGTPAYEYIFVTNQCGNYSGEGSCYNREHSWPQSWFSDGTIPSSDLNHIFPTDGYVNGKRSNYNYGTVVSPAWTSTNGSKLGPNTAPGFTGTVFEPIDAYKGDLARGHFYMSVRYTTEDASWSSSDGTNKSSILPWYADLLFKWHTSDTVSTKEINRNNAVYGIQGNRNPFIDHPEFAAEIWKTAMSPSVVSGKIFNGTTILIDFSRYLDSVAAVNPLNYLLGNGIGAPSSVQWGENNDVSKLRLTYTNIPSGIAYSLQIKNLRSINGVAMIDTTISFNSSGVTAVTENSGTPVSFSLEQNYPNPFNPVTVIKYGVRSMEYGAGNEVLVSLKVYDLLGNEAATLVNEEQAAGTHEVKFDATALSSGVYFYKLHAGNVTLTKKLVVMK